MLKKLKLVWRSLKAVRCDALHSGVVNITAESYECSICQRIIKYDWRIRPVGVTVTLYKPCEKVQQVKSIFVD